MRQSQFCAPIDRHANGQAPLGCATFRERAEILLNKVVRTLFEQGLRIDIRQRHEGRRLAVVVYASETRRLVTFWAGDRTRG